MVETVIFAMLAAFLGLRLYAVLGKRSGHEQGMPKAAEEVVTAPKPAPVTDEVREPAASRAAEIDPFETAAMAGMRAISAADHRFSAADFIDGAKSAYQMILEAFWEGDEETLARYCDEDVRAAFSEAIAARKKAGETLDNRMVSIERVMISRAELNGKIAQITVRFDADIAAVTRDAKGKVIAGSLSDAVPTHDAWTFERNLKASDPNWILVDTDEAA